jgi:hypothetical protein
MQPDRDTPAFRIWGVDNVVYGPVDLPTLVNWVREERVTADTWIHLRDGDSWKKAAGISELQMFFKARAVSGAATTRVNAEGGAAVAFKPGSLRRIKIFAGLSDAQIERFVAFMELLTVRQWTEIIRQGDPGDAMFLILEGEVRVRLMISGKESILTTLGVGEFFGEVALFDYGPRSADVVANQDSVLLKISAGAFQKLIGEASDLAAPFLFAISRTLIARIRADNRRYRDSIAFARSVTE